MENLLNNKDIVDCPNGCWICSIMLTGDENFVNREQYLYESSLFSRLQECKVSLETLHSIHKDITIKDNVFEQFDSVFNKFFGHLPSDHKLQCLSLFEVIFLRVLRLYVPLTLKRAPVFKMSNYLLGGAQIGTGLASIRLDKQNSYLIPSTTNQIVDCEDETFRKFSECVYLTFHNDLPVFSKQIAVRYLVGKVRTMFTHVNNNGMFFRQRTNLAVPYLNHVSTRLREEFARFKQQQIQIHELVGKPGIGKSLSVSSLSEILHVLVPFIPRNDLVYVRANDYWWNGYCGQPIVLYDDFTHLKKNKMKFDFHFELIAMASGTFSNPPMAFDKDMIFTSLLGVVTSNFPLITAVHSQSVEAIKRRIVSMQYHPVEGSVCQDGSLRFEGILLNSIKSKNRHLFSLFAETFNFMARNNQIKFRLLTDKVSRSEINVVDCNADLVSTIVCNFSKEKFSALKAISRMSEDNGVSATSHKEKLAMVNTKRTRKLIRFLPRKVSGRSKKNSTH